MRQVCGGGRAGGRGGARSRRCSVQAVALHELATRLADAERERGLGERVRARRADEQWSFLLARGRRALATVEDLVARRRGLRNRRSKRVELALGVRRHEGGRLEHLAEHVSAELAQLVEHAQPGLLQLEDRETAAAAKGSGEEAAGVHGDDGCGGGARDDDLARLCGRGVQEEDVVHRGRVLGHQVEQRVFVNLRMRRAFGQGRQVLLQTARGLRCTHDVVEHLSSSSYPRRRSASHNAVFVLFFAAANAAYTSG